jgi:NADPH:quinone reductase
MRSGAGSGWSFESRAVARPFGSAPLLKAPLCSAALQQCRHLRDMQTRGDQLRAQAQHHVDARPGHVELVDERVGHGRQHVRRSFGRQRPFVAAATRRVLKRPRALLSARSRVDRQCSARALRRAPRVRAPPLAQRSPLHYTCNANGDALRLADIIDPGGHMKAIRFHRTGGPEVLAYDEVADPSPKAGEVLVRVEAAGVNFADVMRRRGDDYPEPSPTPFILGAEVAGTIAALGPGVNGIEVGTLVLATPGAGGYAQYICVPAATVIPVPPGVSAVQAAAFVGQGLTAALALRSAARLSKGESVLVEAAAGGVGSFAVQLAKLYGAGQVIAAASTPEKRAIAERLGADASVDYSAADWASEVRALTNGRGVDVVVEMVGGESVGQALSAMAPFGRMVYLGQSSGKRALIDPWHLTTPNRTVIGFYIGSYFAFPELIQATLGEIIGFIMTGKISLHVDTVLPLSQASEAHRLLEGRKTTGKVVLQPWLNA